VLNVRILITNDLELGWDRRAPRRQASTDSGRDGSSALFGGVSRHFGNELEFTATRRRRHLPATRRGEIDSAGLKTCRITTWNVGFEHPRTVAVNPTPTHLEIRPLRPNPENLVPVAPRNPMARKPASPYGTIGIDVPRASSKRIGIGISRWLRPDKFTHPAARR